MEIQELIGKINAEPEGVTAVVFSKLEDRKTATDEKIIQLLRALLDNSCNTIQHLDLCDCQLNASHIDLLRQLLSQSTSLKYLYLDGNDKLEGEIVPLVEMILQKEHLLELSIQDIQINEQEREVFSSLIEKSPSLVCFWPESILSDNTYDRLNDNYDKRYVANHAQYEESMAEVGKFYKTRKDECLSRMTEAIDKLSELLRQQWVQESYRAFIRLIGILGECCSYLRDTDDASLFGITRYQGQGGYINSIAQTIISHRGALLHGMLTNKEFSVREQKVREIKEQYNMQIIPCLPEEILKIREHFPRGFFELQKKPLSGSLQPTSYVENGPRDKLECIFGRLNENINTTLQEIDSLQKFLAIKLNLDPHKYKGNFRGFQQNLKKELDSFDWLILQNYIENLSYLTTERNRLFFRSISPIMGIIDQIGFDKCLYSYDTSFQKAINTAPATRSKIAHMSSLNVTEDGNLKKDVLNSAYGFLMYEELDLEGRVHNYFIELRDFLTQKSQQYYNKIQKEKQDNVNDEHIRKDELEKTPTNTKRQKVR